MPEDMQLHPSAADALKPAARLQGLDHLRTLAIVLVFLFHYFILTHGEPGWLPVAAAFGWTGVDLFFVLSGFLIASQLFAQVKAQQAISLKVFFRKRFFRIIPAFLVTVGLYFCFPFFREKEALPPLWKFLTFTQNFGLNLKEQGTFSHAWSLCVEEHFYLLLPLVLVGIWRIRLFRYAGWLLVLLVLAGLWIRHYSFTQCYLPQSTNDNSWVYWYRYIYYPSYTRMDGLLAGVGIAALRCFAPGFWHKFTRHGNYLLMAGLLALTAAWWCCADQQSYHASVFGFPLIAAAYGLIVAGAVSPSSILSRFNSRVSSFIATISYCIYLTHKGMIHITHSLLTDFQLNSNLLLLISICSSLLGAWLLHIAVEKPMLRFRQLR
jgi:peptidoglycan/LPS O-acetylase OafA/YrhL